jgi:hypothetical protein
MLKEVISFHAGAPTLVTHKGCEYWSFVNAGVDTIANYNEDRDIYSVWRQGDEVMQCCGGDLLLFSEIFPGFEFTNIKGVMGYLSMGTT